MSRGRSPKRDIDLEKKRGPDPGNGRPKVPGPGLARTSVRPATPATLAQVIPARAFQALIAALLALPFKIIRPAMTFVIAMEPGTAPVGDGDHRRWRAGRRSYAEAGLSRDDQRDNHDQTEKFPHVPLLTPPPSRHGISGREMARDYGVRWHVHRTGRQPLGPPGDTSFSNKFGMVSPVLQQKSRGRT